MRTEHLHHALSPQAHAALFQFLRLRAERERRATMQRVGQGWPDRLRTLARHLTAPRGRGAATIRLLEG